MCALLLAARLTRGVDNGSMIQQTAKPNQKIKLVAFVVLLLAVVLVAYLFRDSLTLENLAARENEFRRFQDSNPWLMYGAAFLLYVTVAGLALPGAAGLSLAYAWFFGFWPALILISFASTIGATISFLLSRFLLRDSIQSRFGDRLNLINESLKKEGAFYLFTLRLIPAIPFFLVNLLMGLTPLKTWTYWWVSQLGMLPGTAVFVYAGSSVPSLDELAAKGISGIFSPKVFIAFAILGLFPLVIKKALNKFGPPQTVE